MLKSILLIAAAFMFVGCSHQGAPVIPEPPAENPVLELPIAPLPPVEEPNPTPVLPAPKPPVVKPTPTSCVKAGCSSVECVEEKDQGITTTCEFRPEYVCTKKATCERQKNGSCGWTPTAASKACFEDLAKKEAAAKAPVVTPVPEPEPAPAPTLAPAPSAPTTLQATISGFAFSPREIKIKKGDTVIWTQQDNTVHTVTSDSGSELTSDALSIGGTYTHTFTTAGTFAYHCNPHPGMKGTVVVE